MSILNKAPTQGPEGIIAPMASAIHDAVARANLPSAQVTVTIDRDDFRKLKVDTAFLYNFTTGGDSEPIGRRACCRLPSNARPSLPCARRSMDRHPQQTWRDRERHEFS